MKTFILRSFDDEFLRLCEAQVLDSWTFGELVSVATNDKDDREAENSSGEEALIQESVTQLNHACGTPFTLKYHVFIVSSISLDPRT